ncbi:MAG TPA: GNAT family N-acetyltransferase, partial [Polyangiales bacterium]|nr:GNAT family N-acetyltransferase [Polyangiales bacterium]
GDIVAGNRVANFREVAERELRARGVTLQEIRAREIRDGRLGEAQHTALRVTPYATSIGEERFVEIVTGDDRLLGFCRLALPATASFVAELGGSALLRELHVYGAALALGERSAERAQHRGLGKRLVAEASRLAAAAGFTSLAVISAVGTRDYYRKLGFRDGELYQHLAL